MHKIEGSGEAGSDPKLSTLNTLRMLLQRGAAPDRGDATSGIGSGRRSGKKPTSATLDCRS